MVRQNIYIFVSERIDRQRTKTDLCEVKDPLLIYPEGSGNFCCTPTGEILYFVFDTFISAIGYFDSILLGDSLFN